MTISEKLESIKASKEAIKQAIEAKGVACGDALSEYPEKIASIQTGGGIDMSTGVKFAYSTFTTEQFETLNTYNWDKLTTMAQMFVACTGLTIVPPLNTSNSTSFAYTFNECTRLTTVSQLDATKVSTANRTMYNCRALKNLGGFLNLSVSLDLQSSTLLTVESLMNVINNLKDLTGGTAQTLTLGTTNLAKLTDEQKAVATNKNWVLA